MAEIRVGKPDVKIDASAHTKGVPQGNAPGNYEKQAGHHDDDTADARRSTGIGPKRHDPILPIMPNRPPG
jgi:hypothetical protein